MLLILFGICTLHFFKNVDVYLIGSCFFFVVVFFFVFLWGFFCFVYFFAFFCVFLGGGLFGFFLLEFLFFFLYSLQVLQISQFQISNIFAKFVVCAGFHCCGFYHFVFILSIHFGVGWGCSSFWMFSSLLTFSHISRIPSSENHDFFRIVLWLDVRNVIDSSHILIIRFL